MKLWKSKKTNSNAATGGGGGGGGGTSTSCVPGKFANKSQHNHNNNAANNHNEDKSTTASTSSSTTISVERAMSPAQSEDSGLATDRGTTYATISLPRDNVNAMGIVFAERNDLAYPPIVTAINAYGPASDFLAPGDRLHQIDGISTVGLTNNHVLSILMHGEGPAVIDIEYCLPEYISQNSLCVTTKLAQITVERENNCFGLTLRGGSDCPLIVTNVRPHGPVFKTGRIKPGDRLLRVDNISLINKSLLEAQQILKAGSGNASGLTNLTIEYDVSVMQSVEFSLGPLLIEIERPLNDSLGLMLSNYSGFQANDMSAANDVQAAGVFVASILAASIADRCGALSLGDQILSIDDTVIENTALSPDDVMALLDTNTSKGYTQLQIMPSHAIARRGHSNGNYNTIESRKNTKHRKYARKSSLPLEQAIVHPPLGLCRSETIPVVIDCSQGSGLILGSKSPCGRGHIITQILPNSAADRSGCILKGDRILSINKLYNLEASVIRQILGDHHHQGTVHRSNVGGLPGSAIYQNQPQWVEVEIEFDMADSVIPSSGVFNVKLAKMNASGLGITVNATNHGTFVISEVKPGSPAHRTGSLRAGDILLAVDAHTLQHFNVDALLKDNQNELTTLTIKRNSLPDFLFDAQQRGNNIYSNISGNTGRSPLIGLGQQPNGNSNNATENLYSSYKPKLSGIGETGTAGSFKAQSCQPEFYQTKAEIVSSSMEPRETTPQLRRPFLSKSGSADGTCLRRTTLANENTQSLTTEADDQFNDPYDMGDYHQRYDSYDSTTIPPPMESRIYGTHQLVFNVQLDPNGGPLGITLSGSEDMQKPILISGLIEDGCAFNTRQINVGDCLLAINGESVQDVPLSRATKLLQNIGANSVELKLSRNICENEESSVDCDTIHRMTHSQAVYAKVQRRGERSPHFNDAASSSSSSANGSKDSSSGKGRSFHVTLYKDTVYDDYGFSVSDGLYERGVFINRIRTGGPADVVGLLKPFDRIMQVNGVKTHDFDCCLTVPLIASAGDKIEMVLRRSLTVGTDQCV